MKGYTNYTYTLLYLYVWSAVLFLESLWSHVIFVLVRRELNTVQIQTKYRAYLFLFENTVYTLQLYVKYKLGAFFKR